MAPFYLCPNRGPCNFPLHMWSETWKFTQEYYHYSEHLFLLEEVVQFLQQGLKSTQPGIIHIMLFPRIPAEWHDKIRHESIVKQHSCVIIPCSAKIHAAWTGDFAIFKHKSTRCGKIHLSMSSQPAWSLF